MLRKEIAYTDFDGNEVKEVCYFHLNKVELIGMELKDNKGFQQYIQRILDTDDTDKIFQTFKEIVLKSYGVRSEDGKRFFKDPQRTLEFESSNAFEELIMEMIQSETFAAEFVTGILPKDLNKGV